MKVSAVQFCHAPGDVAGNLAQVVGFVQQGAMIGVQVMIFPECCLPGYWHLRNLSRSQLEELAERIPEGDSSQSVLKMAKRYQMTIGVGLLEVSQDGRLFNSFFIANADGSWANHRKIHCFISPHLDSGDSYTVFNGPGNHRFGVLTCYDNNLIENVRATALLGAEILLAPHQTGGCDSGSPGAMGVIPTELWERRDERWKELVAECNGDKGRGWLMRWLPSRAHDSGMFLVFSNGVGRDDNEVRTGNSMILDPYGRILKEAEEPREMLVTAELDFGLRDRSTGVRWMQARRPELYELLTKRTGSEKDTRTVRFDHLGPAER
ncbi:MAG: nitrilase-related carbon-nitrogen hydrolase [Planctomycetota bacterium]|nr:nitrilase-related carbon-nitrogen hydrolase [Planctomycetota bacterium]